MSTFVFRDALASDEDEIFALAGHLDTLNLPPDRGFIRDLLARSQASFAGGLDPEVFDPERRFLFVLQGPSGEVVGTSMIHAQHGTRREPHVFFRVVDEERYAEITVGDEHRDVHMIHKMLQLGLTYQGPTEIGGLVLRPDLRRHPRKLGRLLSFGRFSYIAAHRQRFRDRVLAELLPPLERGPLGRAQSRLWDALGSRFTNLTYAEADRLSSDDKEFIWRLFPQSTIHVSLLPREVQDIIGQVGPETLGAMRLLQSIGFADSGKVDPFDGGPHWEANTDDLTLVRDAQWCRAAAGNVGEHAIPGIVARVRQDHEPEDAPRFRAVWTHVRDQPPREVDVRVDDYGVDWVQDTAGDWVLPGPATSRESRHGPPRRVTLAEEDLAALRLPEGDEKVLVALRPQHRVAG
ncbi:arginine N-succinyltransferase [Pseudenhygromyxa sp. WMMC2535]|uniref:arginine N-succinyltransferase n=1 Tax=Pseudenhygromyxa sp. WMMC2535 TaxID=2712867 RepID=UPI001552A148|nr:arginine N-succinyltransferase [Pseudenhygromyxa sp. WMMC2535]NVB37295.1 arginine N-succinyltransferase [Pseudenhygromyxa sp. WMMC2535]